MPTKTHRRHPNGQIEWTPTLQKRVRRLILNGWSYARIAECVGLTRSSLLHGIYEYGLADPPEQFVPLRELWAALAFESVEAFAHHVKNQGLPLHRVGTKCPCLPRRVAQALLAEQGARPVLRERPPGTVTQHELMVRWGMAQSSVQDRLVGLPYRRMRSAGAGGLLHLYDERDVDRVAPPVAPRDIPRGFVGSTELARLTGRTGAGVRRWARLGCPHIRTRQGDLCFRPADVAVWLAARPDPRVSRTGRWLAQQLEQGRAA